MSGLLLLRVFLVLLTLRWTRLNTRHPRIPGNNPINPADAEIYGSTVVYGSASEPANAKVCASSSVNLMFDVLRMTRPRQAFEGVILPGVLDIRVTTEVLRTSFRVEDTRARV